MVKEPRDPRTPKKVAKLGAKMTIISARPTFFLKKKKVAKLGAKMTIISARPTFCFFFKGRKTWR